MSVEPIANASVGGDPGLAQARQRGRAVAVDAQLEDLVAELGEQALGRVQADDLPLVHDRDAVAELARLLEVVGREQDRDVQAVTQAGDQIEQLVSDARIQTDRRLVEEQHLGS